MDLGVSHLVKSAGNSVSGLKIAFANEQAFRHECCVFVALTAVLALTGKPAQVWLGVLSAWLGVMAVELLNSAIEKTCDLVTKEYHPLIKAAKDMASAAIFVAIAANAGLWLAVFVL